MAKRFNGNTFKKNAGPLGKILHAYAMHGQVRVPCARRFWRASRHCGAPHILSPDMSRIMSKRFTANTSKHIAGPLCKSLHAYAVHGQVRITCARRFWRASRHCGAPHILSPDMSRILSKRFTANTSKHVAGPLGKSMHAYAMHGQVISLHDALPI